MSANLLGYVYGSSVRFELECLAKFLAFCVISVRCGVGSPMATSKSLKNAVLVSAVSAAISVLVTYVGKQLLSRIDKQKQFALEDKKLTRSLKDSMDCSDPIAKY